MSDRAEYHRRMAERLRARAKDILDNARGESDDLKRQAAEEDRLAAVEESKKVG